MGLRQQISAAVRDRLLGVSTYQPPPLTGATFDLDSPEVKARRRIMYGGLLTPALGSQSRWYLEDVEAAERAADNGNIMPLARIMHAARRDGVFAGVLSTRTGGLVRLPKRFRGDEDLVHELEAGHDSVRSIFDEMCPPQELALMAGDGFLCGVAVAELVDVVGRDFPVLVRHDPRCLYFRFAENRWYFRSPFGDLPITPGNGRWVLHTPGGRVAPWNNAAWRAIALAYIRKDHAGMNKDIWEAKLAHPARVAQSPQGASEAQTQSWFRQVMAWGKNTVFGAPPGYEVKLLESNGRGYDCFLKTIADCNETMIITVAGQSVTTTGGDAAFQNSDIHKTIRADLIKESADGLAYTLNTQVLPVYVAITRGEDAIDDYPVSVEWDVTPPKDRNSEALSLVTAAQAITQLDEALRPSGLALNTAVLGERFAIPTIEPADKQPDAPMVGADGKPTLTVIQGGKSSGGEVIAPVDTAPGDNPAQDTALNGAQIASLLDIVRAVVAGEIPRDAGIAMIQRAFNTTREQSETLMGSAGAGFEPTAPAAPPANVMPPSQSGGPQPKPDEAAA